MSYILQIIDSARFMASSLSNLVNNLSKGIHKMTCKYGNNDKKCGTWGIKYKYCDCFLKCTSFKGNLIEYKCLPSNKNYQQKFDEKLKGGFFKTHNFSNHDNNKFLLLLRKGVYPYE